MDTTGVEIWPEGLVLYEEFQILRTLGRGGLGPVYLARCEENEREYVVKRVQFVEETQKGKFQLDLQSWMYLPEHPNLTQLCFFRTEEGEVDLFIEFVKGSSLKALQQTGKIYEGGPKTALLNMLDIAIQMAWGLKALHEIDMQHGNLKPDNILVTPKFDVRITDIGLDRFAAHGYASDQDESVGVSPYYESPESAKEQELKKASEVWNWGVVVLEMFLGIEQWSDPKVLPQEELEKLTKAARAQLKEEQARRRGPLANEALQRYLKNKPVDDVRPALPQELASVLEKCFQEAPLRRWKSFDEIATTLRRIYRDSSGTEHPRRLPTVLHRQNLLAIAHARWTKAGGAHSPKPEEWLTKAAKVTGEQPAHEKVVGFHKLLSRAAQLTKDIAGYEQARHEFEYLVKAGHAELRSDLAILCVDEAFIHISADNLMKGLKGLDQAIQIWEDLVHKEGHAELAHDLAMTYLHKGRALEGLEACREAIEIFDRAIEIWTRLIKEEGRKQLAANLGWVRALRANALLHVGRQSMVQAKMYRESADEAKKTAEDEAEKERAAAEAVKARVAAEAKKKRAEEEAEKERAKAESEAKDRDQEAVADPEEPQDVKEEQEDHDKQDEDEDDGEDDEDDEDDEDEEERADKNDRGEAVVIDKQGVGGKEVSDKGIQGSVENPGNANEAEEGTPEPTVSQQLELQCKNLATQAEETKKTAQSMFKESEKEGRLALSILRSEVKRTDRNDIRAILHWVESKFE